MPGKRTRGGESEATAEGEAFLRHVPLFAGLSEEQRARVLAAATVVRVPAGGWLFKEGDEGDALYVVRTGRLEVLRDGVVIRVLGAGAALGELALLTAGDRSASVRARRETEVLRVGQSDFAALLGGDPAFAVALTRTLGQQLQRTAVAAAPASNESRVVTFVPLVPGEAACAAASRVADAVLTALVAMGLKAELLRGGESDDPGAFGRLLDRCEDANDHVLLLADEAAGKQWGEFCLRQADRVVGVVDPTSGRPEAAAPEVTDIAFVNRVPRATFVGPWLEAVRPATHHQVDPGPRFDADAARLARRLAGRSVGLVLSGGGARGMAHIGVMRALAEAGIVIDRLGGTSMGSFMAGLAAMGLSPDEMQQAARSELVARKPFNDYTVPRHSLIKARKAEAMLLRVFGHRRIEELDRTYFAVSADLLTGDEVVHQRGPVAVAVGISMCLPGLVPPVVAGDRLLVDGGVLNNLPVDVLAASGEGPIIAVDVMRKPPTRDREGKPVRSRSRGRARGRPSPFGLFSADDDVPSLVDTLARATVLGSWRRADANRLKAALVISPELMDVGLLEFRKLDQLAARGYAAAVDALATAPATLFPCP